MGIKKYNPTTPSLRQMTCSTFEEIDKVAPEKSLLRPLHSKADVILTVELLSDIAAAVQRESTEL